MRIGRDVPASSDPWGEEDSNEEAEKSYFAPRVCSKDSSPDEAETSYCRQWSIMVQVQDNKVLLFAIPLGWRDPEDEDMEFDEEEAAEGAAIPFYLAAKMTLPPGGSIRDVGFYNDDGKSSLSSGNDSGTGKEGRQKLGILYQQQQDDSSKLDLWLASYDDLIWQSLPFEATLIDGSQITGFASYNLQAMEEGEENGASQTEDESIRYAQSKSLWNDEILLDLIDLSNMSSFRLQPERFPTWRALMQ
jgi:hypothetical protein